MSVTAPWIVVALASSSFAAETANGLNVEFFRDRELKSPVARRIDPNIDWHWAYARPHPDVPADHFSARWSGWIKAPQAGRYNLTLMGDDGFRLSLDGLPVIDAWKGGSPKSATVELTGRPQAIEIEYCEFDRGAWLTFWWQPLGVDRPSIVPAEALFPDEESANAKAKKKRMPAHGLIADYFSGGFKKPLGRSLVHRTEAIWGDWSAEPGGPVDGAARYNGFLVPPKSGRYKLMAYADDRLRVWIDDKPVLEAKWEQERGQSNTFVDLQAETAHAITIEYEDHGNWGSYFLHWIPPETEHEVSIPCEALYPTKQSLPKGIGVGTK